MAALQSAYGHLERGLCCFDPTNSLHWFYLTGPSISEVVCLHLNGDKKLDVICGSDAPDNGNVGPDGTDDSHGYIYALSPEGKCLWTSRLSDEYSQVHPLVVTTNRQGAQGLFAWVSFSGRYARREAGKREIGPVFRLDGKGAITATTNLDSEIVGCVAADLDLDGQQKLVVTTYAGDVWVLSPDLKPVRKQHLGPKNQRDLCLELLAVGDLNQDGRPELICRLRHERAPAHWNPGHLTEPQSVIQVLDLRLYVLDSQLQVLASYRLPPTRGNPDSASATIGDISHTGRNQLLYVGDMACIFDLRPRKFFEFW